uniref:Uncharacterized protein n=1 Tax=Aegilops tauschii subsp. strangulata TaxID=200361 RepID=A0A453LGN1_AEGTS
MTLLVNRHHFCLTWFSVFCCWLSYTYFANNYLSEPTEESAIVGM